MGRRTLTIRDWAAEDRPSDKMASLGRHAVTDTELLSVIIGSGTTNMTAVDVARQLLALYGGSLRRLRVSDKRQLEAVQGIGKAKAAKILAALELGNRMWMEHSEERQDLSTPIRVFNYMRPHLLGLDTEEFWALFCDQHFRLLRAQRLFVGGISEVMVDIRLILKEALMLNATVIYACHNHPSGSRSPSRYDDELTLSLKQACKVMRLYFADHIIVTDNNYYSFHEEEKI